MSLTGLITPGPRLGPTIVTPASGTPPVFRRKIAAATPSADQTYAVQFAMQARAVGSAPDANGIINSFNLGFQTSLGMAGGNGGDGRPLFEVTAPNHPRQPVFCFTNVPPSGVPTNWASGQTYPGTDGSVNGNLQAYCLAVPVPLGADLATAFPVYYGPGKVVIGNSSGLESGGSDNSLSIADYTTDQVWDFWKFGAFNVNTYTAGQSLWNGVALITTIGTASLTNGATYSPGNPIVLATGAAPAMGAGTMFTVGTALGNSQVFTTSGAVSAGASAIPVVSRVATVSTGTSSVTITAPQPPAGYVPPLGDGWYYVCGNVGYMGSLVGTPASQIAASGLHPDLPPTSPGSNVGSTSADMPPGTYSPTNPIPCSGGSGGDVFAGKSITVGSTVFVCSKNTYQGATSIPVNPQTTTVDIPSGTAMHITGGIAQGAGATNFVREAGAVTHDDLQRGIIDHALRIFISVGGPYYGAAQASTGLGFVGKTSSSIAAGAVTSIPVSGGANFPLLNGQHVTVGGVVFQVATTGKVGTTPIAVVSKTIGSTIASGSNVTLTGDVGSTSADMPAGTPVTAIPCNSTASVGGASYTGTNAALWAGATITVGATTFVVSANTPAGTTTTIPVSSVTPGALIPSGSPITAICNLAPVAKGDSLGFPFGQSSLKYAPAAGGIFLASASTLTHGTSISSIPLNAALTSAQAALVLNGTVIVVVDGSFNTSFTCSVNAVAGDTAIAVTAKTLSGTHDYSGATVSIQPHLYTYQVPEGSYLRLRPDYVIPALGTTYSLYPELVGAALNPTVVIDQLAVMLWTCMRDYGFFVTDGGTNMTCYAREINSCDTPYSHLRLADYNALMQKLAPLTAAFNHGIWTPNTGSTGSKNPFANGPWLAYSDGMPVVQIVEWGSW